MTKTFAITGVSTGIGAEIARLLKTDGHRIIGFDIAEQADNVDRLIHLDLADPESITQAAMKLDEPLDGLCNNAGIPPREEGNAQSVLQINFISQRLFTNAVLKKLNPGSAVVNMASRAGHQWRDNLEQVLKLSRIKTAGDLANFIATHGIDSVRAYNLSKEAMILWTMSETETLIRHNLRMNSISPGAVSTGILDDFAKAFGDKMTKNVARAGRPATAEDVAKTAVFLLSDKSSWLKGIDIPVDGGMGACAASDLLGLKSMTLIE